MTLGIRITEPDTWSTGYCSTWIPFIYLFHLHRSPCSTSALTLARVRADLLTMDMRGRLVNWDLEIDPHVLCSGMRGLCGLFLSAISALAVSESPFHAGYSFLRRLVASFVNRLWYLDFCCFCPLLSRACRESFLRCLESGEEHRPIFRSIG
ncbi:uncharacterized protein BP01DRAFT_111278 [Aspergillus saccharolyticus JOP 1030-1]|uniref:Uncharacterized protein n=1 Tax=Aspergillus saccharolyticus JOP 1030-1 TaxID=1450539 RepID=A0A319AAT0_9EURO|nr:hypothetical protein BP01DRAFT_111278 [Aspergillus saccharolyticus JOP 1030-1]PYH48738.1 hypothetical protein BP01DRAFT_111278 [Aspergillus saccharolyticus JOP 1030-1]